MSQDKGDNSSERGQIIENCIATGNFKPLNELSFPKICNDLILRAARGLDVEKVPVWIMRQAGRYLPEFRKVRENHDFFSICNTPALACEVTLQPILRFELDAAIIFSDILVIPQALGMTVEMLPGKGPNFPQPLVSEEDAEKLINSGSTSESRKAFLQPVYDAITLTRHRLDGRCPLIGFSGSPWTLFSYMIEGGGSTTQSKAKRWLYSRAELSHRLLQFITQAVIEHLMNQVRAGAQLLQVFDSHAGILSPSQFHEFSLPYLNEIASSVRFQLNPESSSKDPAEYVPLIVFAKDAHFSLKELRQSGYDVVSLDWAIDRTFARSELGGMDHVTVQGNLDPCALYANANRIETEVRKMLTEFELKRLIANLGHGIYPDIDPEKVKIFVDAVHKISSEMLKN